MKSNNKISYKFLFFIFLTHKLRYIKKKKIFIVQENEFNKQIYKYIFFLFHLNIL